ncbi:MAG TPA: tetratricopeptide repeat protein [Thermodesulfovibrionales bacterium]|nr:tetratricopeptide repeat protein [Thermodesulfovibrionales bacterium]
MNKLKKFITALFILFLFTGCRTGILLERPQNDLHEIEHALLEGKWDAVMTYSEELLVREPENAIVHFLLSVAYYMKGEYELQEKQYPWVLKDQQSMDAIVVWCENLVQRFPQNYYARFLLGSAYPIKDEAEKAIENYKKAIEINPNLADAYVGLGTIYLDDEQVDEAIKYFKRAIEINPAYIAAYLNLGATYEYNDQLDEAIVSYEKTIEINPRIVRVYVSLGDLYLQKGDRDKAIKAYEKIIELEPNSELGIYAKDAIEKAQADSDKDTADTKEQRKP